MPFSVTHIQQAMSADVPGGGDDVEHQLPSTSTSTTATSVSSSPVSCVRRAFSPLGLESDHVAVGYVVVEWAVKPTSFAYSLFHPLMVAALGDAALGDGQGKSLWAFLSAAIAVGTVVVFLTFASLMEYGRMKLGCLYFFGGVAASTLLLFVFCFSPGAVYLASLLAVTSKVSQRVVDLAFEALLDAVCLTAPTSYTTAHSTYTTAAATSTGAHSTSHEDQELGTSDKAAVPPPPGSAEVKRDPHQMSSRAAVTGYLGMLSFILCLAPVLAAVYFGAHASTLWVEGILPTAAIGLWYLAFLYLAGTLLPGDLGLGGSIPRPAGWSEAGGAASNGPVLLLAMLALGFWTGVRKQLESLRAMLLLRDLSVFVLAYVFLSGASSTALSVAAIVASEVLHVSVVFIAAGALVGLLAAILGLVFFKWLLRVWPALTVKHVIAVNIGVLLLLLVYILYAETLASFFVISLVGGSQIGTLGSFSRSIVSSLVPRAQQAQFFAFYELTQDGTAWVGPLVIGALTASLGGAAYVRVVVFVCMVEIGIGLPIFLALDLERGVALRLHIDSLQDSTVQAAAAAAAAAVIRGDDDDDVIDNNKCDDHGVGSKKDASLVVSAEERGLEIEGAEREGGGREQAT